MSYATFRERFGKVLDSAGQMFLEIDRNFRVVYANGVVKKVLGDPVGQVCHQFMACSDRICDDCPVRQVFQGEERACSERVGRDRHGNPIWIQQTVTPIRDDKGELIGASELIVDVSARKQVEEGLRDSERWYRNLVEEVPDVIFSLDREGRFAFINTQAEKFLGYPVRRLLETRLRDHVVPEDSPRIDEILQLRPNTIWDEEVGILDAEGNKKYARIRCKASFDAEGRLFEFEGVMRDRTAARKLEEELKMSRAALVEKIKIIDELYEHILQSGKCRAIEEHTAEVAHELRQPLAIVGGFARRLAKQLDSEARIDMPRQKQYVGIIITEIERLERILDRLIDFTERGYVRLQRMNPNDLIQYILDITVGKMAEKRIELRSKLGSEIGEVPLDPGRFQQLVLNLVSNAVEASPEGGVIEVETGASIPSDKALKTGDLRAEIYFEMKIRNSGPAIPPKELEQIFNPFFTTKEHGTGLGLPVSKKIVDDHCGSISVKSDDNGTVFTIWLPFA